MRILLVGITQEFFKSLIELISYIWGVPRGAKSSLWGFWSSYHPPYFGKNDYGFGMISIRESENELPFIMDSVDIMIVSTYQVLLSLKDFLKDRVDYLIVIDNLGDLGLPDKNKTKEIIGILKNIAKRVDEIFIIKYSKIVDDNSYWATHAIVTVIIRIMHELGLISGKREKIIENFRTFLRDSELRRIVINTFEKGLKYYVMKFREGFP
ncbi:MAG: hypothetical protein ACTSX9_04440 [Candidatus Njordarchaeales archaeon]